MDDRDARRPRDPRQPVMFRDFQHAWRSIRAMPGLTAVVVLSLAAGDDVTRAGAKPVVVVSDAFWRTRLGGRGDLYGQGLRVNNRDLTIVGVTPPEFQGTVIGLAFDLWVPATLAPDLLGSQELD